MTLQCTVMGRLWVLLRGWPPEGNSDPDLSLHTNFFQGIRFRFRLG